MEKRLRDLLDNGDFSRVDDERKKVMRSNKAKDTKPEMVVRSLLHMLGYRFRLHRKDLPSKPDIVLPKHKKIIEVYGCFWHSHDCPIGRRSIRRNSEYWKAKLQGNRERSTRNLKQLEELDWQVLVIWECETSNLESLANKVLQFMDA